MSSYSLTKERCYYPSRELTRRLYTLRQNQRHNNTKPIHPLPDNSVLWGDLPQSIAEALAISDQIDQLSANLRRNLLST